MESVDCIIYCYSETLLGKLVAVLQFYFELITACFVMH